MTVLTHNDPNGPRTIVCGGLNSILLASMGDLTAALGRPLLDFWGGSKEPTWLVRAGGLLFYIYAYTRPEGEWSVGLAENRERLSLSEIRSTIADALAARGLTFRLCEIGGTWNEGRGRYDFEVLHASEAPSAPLRLAA